MAVIFVHGVNIRIENPDYETRRQVTEGFLKRCLMGASITACGWRTLLTRLAENRAPIRISAQYSKAGGIVSR